MNSPIMHADLRRENKQSPQRTASDQTAMFWVLGLVAVQMICQLGLLFELFSQFRVVFRVGSYALTLAAFTLVSNSGQRRHHPAFWLGIFSLGTIALQILNPTTNTVASAVATLMLNLAIMSPLFWVPRLEITARVLSSVCMFLWLFHTLSASIGVLQVYFPGQYQPALSQAVKDAQYGGEHLRITLASGDYVYRPMGLTDIPGGAAMAGMYSFLFSIALFGTARSPVFIIGGILSMPIGLFCIYVSQVRMALVVVLIISLCFAAMLAAKRWYGAAARVAFIVPFVGAAAFTWAVALGGESTVSRFETLVEDNPAEIYSKNRGMFLSETFDRLLPEYPFGAGLGRWGMMNAYFGDNTLPDSFMIWVEIQWTAWILDGGIILMFGYVGAVMITMLNTTSIALRSRNSEIASWAMLVLAYDVAVMSMTFSYVPFYSQGGMEFWLLNMLVFAANRNEESRRPLWPVG